jgi:phthalate 4,5-cis-dihydrodiol dehydrogenase
MLPTFVGDARVSLVAAVEPRAEARARFAAEFSAKTYETVEALCDDPEVDAVYIATPHQHHAAHATLAAARGKHLLIEKPLALTLDECNAIIEAVQRAGVQLVVGHSHSFDAPVARARSLISSGEFGAMRMITALNFTDFIYRPRRTEELDTARGGGAVFNQAAHQIDVVRLLGGGCVRSVRAVTGAWDAHRPTEGAYAALLTFETGAFASVIYNGYGHFDSDEFQGWIGEMGYRKAIATERQSLSFADEAEEAAAKAARNYGGAAYRPSTERPRAHQHFGPVLVSCDAADLRLTPEGVMIYRNGTGRLERLPPPAVPRVEVIDELYGAVVEGRRPLHSGAWATATLEVCLAILRSAREQRDIALHRQVAADV